MSRHMLMLFVKMPWAVFALAIVDILHAVDILPSVDFHQLIWPPEARVNMHKSDA